MTLDQIVKIQSVIDKRAIASDTLEFLNTKRYSNSKQCMIRYGDMHIDHFLRVCATEMPDNPYIEDDMENQDSTSPNLSGEEMYSFLKNKIVKEFGNGNN
tara:strand:+ start:445 stop:744 length:300 start_codon:yes stop_codon:yes gene_type:complete